MKEPYFPLFVNLAHKKILVVGGGKIATRRVATLLDFNCLVTVIAPEVTLELKTLQQKHKIQIIFKSYQSFDLKGFSLVLAATNCCSVNDQVTFDCKKANIPVNHCGNRSRCDFYFPGIVKKENVIIGITTSGHHHSLVKELKKRIQHLIDSIQS